MCQKGHSKIVVRQSVKELEITIVIRRFEGYACRSFALVCDIDLVRGRVDVSQSLASAYLDLAGDGAELLKRHRTASRVGTNIRSLPEISAGSERIAIGHGTGLGLQYLRVNELELLVRMWRDRKDRRLKQIFPSVFKQARILLPANDLVVYPTRLFAAPDLTDEFLPILPDRELDDRSGLRDREKVCTFQRVRGIVSEYLLDPSRGHLSTDLRIELYRLNGEHIRQRDRSRYRPRPARQ